MAELVKKIKNLKHQAYNEYTADSLLKQLDHEENKERNTGYFSILGLIDKQGYTQALFSADSSDLKTAEGFAHKFLTKLHDRNPEEFYEDFAAYLKEQRREVSFSRLSFAIQYLSNANFKTHERVFSEVCDELFYLADTFYRVIFEVFVHKAQQLGEPEQKILLSTGYRKTSNAVDHFIKSNKKILDFTTGKFTALKITDFLAFDGENIEKFNTVTKSQLNVNAFLRLIGNLKARMDFVKFFNDANAEKDLHEIVQFKDLNAELTKLDSKISVDPLAIIESESLYFQYRKYHVLSLRRDKMFNLHKNIVVNTDQEDEHLAPANETWEGYGGFYPAYLLRNHLIKEKSLYSFLNPKKLAKLITHVLCSVPENTYTGGEYYLPIIQFLQAKIERCNFDVFGDLNQDNSFWYDTFVAVKRIDFNIKPKNRPIVTSFFNFLMSKVQNKQTRFILCTKFLDMDYVETFFHTSSFGTGVLQLIYDEIQEAKFNAFSSPEIFLRKEGLEKMWGHITKGDHKMLGMMRSGVRIFLNILNLLKDFNAADWLPANTLGQFYLSLDPTALDPLKESLLTRVTECKEIIDRKQQGLFTGDIAKMVDAEYIADVKQEARELREMANILEDLKLAYMEK